MSHEERRLCRHLNQTKVRKKGKKEKYLFVQTVLLFFAIENNISPMKEEGVLGVRGLVHICQIQILLQQNRKRERNVL